MIGGDSIATAQARAKSKSKNKIDVPWRPQERQLTFLRACGLSHPFDGGGPKPPVAVFVGYGGAAGGGKTDSLVGVAIIAGLTFPGINIGIFRRTYSQLEGPGGIILRSQELMASWASYNGGMRRWTMPNGSLLQFCHCENENDVYNYQSQQFDILLFDEMTQFSGTQIRYLLSRNRATKNGVIPFAAGATNPGGIGHIFFKEQFVDPGEPEQVHNVEVEPGIFEEHIFIPAKLADNQILERRDPAYRKKLEAQPEDVRRALLYGDFDIFSGQFYPEYKKEIHVVKPFEVPAWWKRIRSLDYGLDMTACLWWAIADNGQCYAYRELHEPNLNLSKAAKKIVDMTPSYEYVSYTTASPDLWNRRQETGQSGVEIMGKAGLKGLVRAKHDRIQGWRAMREYIEPYDVLTEDGDLLLDEFGKPRKSARIQIFETLPNFIKYLPMLQRDEHDLEDAADKPHIVTHVNESARYFCMSRHPTDSKQEQLLFPKGTSAADAERIRTNMDFAKVYAKMQSQQQIRGGW